MKPLEEKLINEETPQEVREIISNFLDDVTAFVEDGKKKSLTKEELIHAFNEKFMSASPTLSLMLKEYGSTKPLIAQMQATVKAELDALTKKVTQGADEMQTFFINAASEFKPKTEDEKKNAMLSVMAFFNRRQGLVIGNNILTQRKKLTKEEREELLSIYKEVEALRKKEPEIPNVSILIRLTDGDAPERLDMKPSNDSIIATAAILSQATTIFKEQWDGTVHERQTASEEERKQGKELSIGYSLKLDKKALAEYGISISRDMGYKEQRYFMAVLSLYNEGNRIMTLSQIHKKAGFARQPNSREIKDLNRWLTQWRHTDFKMSNKKEAMGRGTPYRICDAALLSFRRERVIFKGATTSAIAIGETSPILEFLLNTKQYTTVADGFLQSPITRTDTNIAIESWILERYAREKRAGKSKFTVKRDTVYKEFVHTSKANESRERRNADDTMRKVFQNLKEKGGITRYEETEKGITGTIKKTAAATKKRPTRKRPKK